MNDPFVRLWSGKRLYYLHPRPADFDIESIASALSKICRFSGNTRVFLSVAEHCCRVHDIAPEEVRKEALLHDAVESATNDAPSPIKMLLPQFKEIEIRLERALARRFRLRFPFPSAVKLADLTMLVTEQKWLMPGDDYKTLGYNPLPRFTPWSMKRAEREFLTRFHRLYKR